MGLLGEEDLLEGLEGLDAHGSPNRLAVAEKHQSGDTLHTSLRCQFLILVHINLEDCHAIAQFSLELLQDAGLHLARTAPRGKEIDQHEFIAHNNFIKFAHSLKKLRDLAIRVAMDNYCVSFQNHRDKRVVPPYQS